jgi:hypothetical protein
MQMAALLFYLLSLSIAAHAGLIDGRAVLPHCQLQASAPASVACRNEDSNSAISALLPVAEKITNDEQVRRMKEYGHRRISIELANSIRARRALLACMKKAGDQACAERLNLLRSKLERNVRRLRLALAISNIPTTLYDRSVSSQIQLPAALGSTPLPPLSAKETEEARSFQNEALKASERVGLENLRAQLGRAESSAELTKRCHAQDPELIEYCASAQGVHESSFLKFRLSMEKISETIIGELPFVLSFSAAPISDADLKIAIKNSLDTLKEWKDENGAEDDDNDDTWSTFLSDNRAFTDEYVALHPEACAAAEHNIRATSAMQIGKDALASARDVVATTVVCSVASPLVCIAASGAVFARDTHTSFSEWSQVRSRLKSADRPNPQANMVAADDAFRDLLVTAALDGLDTASYAKWALKGGEDFYPLKEFIKDVEGDPKSFASTAGEMFQTLSENVRDDLKLAGAIGLGEAANGQHHRADPQSYNEWLESDAYTARVYEAFERATRKKP